MFISVIFPPGKYLFEIVENMVQNHFPLNGLPSKKALCDCQRSCRNPSAAQPSRDSQLSRFTQFAVDLICFRLGTGPTRAEGLDRTHWPHGDGMSCTLRLGRWDLVVKFATLFVGGRLNRL